MVGAGINPLGELIRVNYGALIDGP